MSRINGLLVLFQWLGRVLLTADSSVFLQCTLNWKSAEAWPVSGCKKCNGFVEVKR